jgi:hypothetical protein
MQSGGAYLQGYNCQLAVDIDHQVIVAIGVSNQLISALQPILYVLIANPHRWLQQGLRDPLDEGR